MQRIVLISKNLLYTHTSLSIKAIEPREMAEKTEEGFPRARLLLLLLRFVVVWSSSSKEICRKFKDLDNTDLNGLELSRRDFVDSESKGPPKSILSNDFDKTALIILCSSSMEKKQY